MKLPHPIQMLYRALLSEEYSNVEITRTNDLINIKGGSVYDGKDYLSEAVLKVTKEGLRFVRLISAPTDHIIWTLSEKEYEKASEVHTFNHSISNITIPKRP